MGTSGENRIAASSDVGAFVIVYGPVGVHKNKGLFIYLLNIILGDNSMVYS